MFELAVEKTIAAAHYLRNFSGRCERLHGHNYRIIVFLQGEQLDDAGMLVDFTLVKESMSGILDKLDHYCLNDLPEFAEISPSAENIARVIGDFLARQDFGRARLHRVQVWETPNQSATYFVS
ncbi:MAG: 6-carboxytetrahydropterin synthase QueD [Cytophagales bacterium]|nr:6-carboxytetrahydropterin synthase QueD [Armatimonadota bacterium]